MVKSINALYYLDERFTVYGERLISKFAAQKCFATFRSGNLDMEGKPYSDYPVAKKLMKFWKKSRKLSCQLSVLIWS